jgi:xanthine dehydrogenase YagS FAD-binding subunit
MQPFEYANPASLNEAFGLLGPTWNDAMVLAGGTDLISSMKDRLAAPKRVVNIKNITELHGISARGRELTINAVATIDEVAKDSAIRKNFAAIAEAAEGIPSPQIRHMGTAGGDLCQRPRCWYYRQGFGLLGMKDGKPLIPNGENKYHAIFGDGPAYFVSASSLGPALIAHGARLKLASAKGSREVAAAGFFVAPKDENTREIVLRPDEILTAIVVPIAAGTRSATYEVRQKEALDWPLVAASVVLHMNGNRVSSAKIVLGHVAPTPWDSPAAAAAITGKSITAETAEAAGKAAVSDAKPLSQNAYKVTLAKVAVKRALLQAAGVKA